MYVEHPIGTGYSYGNPYPETEKEASGDLDAFLQNFFAVFTDLAQYDFYVVGESYAGMFVPSVSRFFHRANQEALAEGDDKRIQIRLKGAALGNGWIDVRGKCWTLCVLAVCKVIHSHVFPVVLLHSNRPRFRDPPLLIIPGGTA